MKNYGHERHELVDIDPISIVGNYLKQKRFFLPPRYVDQETYKESDAQNHIQAFLGLGINARSASLMSISLSSTRKSNIISDASSCLHFLPALQKH
jgi:hypothetical protein